MTIRERLRRLDWRALEESLWERGYARTPPLLSEDECRSLIAVYADDGRFRKHVDMARLRFGVGDYRYFREPLPPLVQELRVHGYRLLAPIVNRWFDAYGDRRRFPTRCASFVPPAPRRARPSRRRCCSATARGATTASTRTYTARWRSRCR